MISGKKKVVLSGLGDESAGSPVTTINGSVYNSFDNSMLFDVRISFVDSSGNIIDSTSLNAASNTYTLWTYRPGDIFVLFQKNGFQDFQIPFSDLQNIPEVYMQPSDAGTTSVALINPPLNTIQTIPLATSKVPMALLAGGLLFLIVSSQKKKKMGALTTENVLPWILVGGGVLAVVGVTKITAGINNMLVGLGLAKGQGSIQTQNQQSDPNSVWKPSYWQTQTSTPPLDYSLAATMSKTIFSSFGLFSDDFESIMSVFNQLSSQSQVSYLADVFSQQTFRDPVIFFSSASNLDLLTFLTNGGGVMPWDGLSDSHLKTLTDYVNNLPQN